MNINRTRKTLLYGMILFILICFHGTSHAVTLTPSINPAQTNQVVTFTVTVTTPASAGNNNCPVFMDFDEGTGPEQVATINNTTTFMVTHSFAEPGNYLVTVQTGPNCNVIPPTVSRVSLVVNAPPPIPGTIRISAVPNPVYINQDVVFTIPVQVQSNMACPIYIDFNDGTGQQQLAAVSSDTVLTAVHSYSVPGTYIVTVRSTPNCPALANAFAVTTVRAETPLGSMNISATPDSAFVNQEVAFRIPVQIQSASPCPVYIDYDDGSAVQQLASISEDTTLMATHAFSAPGTYRVTVRSGPDCPALAGAQAVATVRIRDFVIERIQLYFDNDRPEITLDLNDSPPGVFVKINYSGAGYLKGYWEVDGIRRHNVFKHLGSGFQEIFRYPDVPPLATYTPGTHRVRFIITDPPMNINFPVALYYVTSHEKIKPVNIRLIAPENNEEQPYEPVGFRWQTVPEASLYFFRLFSGAGEGGQMIFSAYTTTGEYQIRPDVLKFRMTPQNIYSWDVEGYNADRQKIAQSERRPFRFTTEAAAVPGQILLVTEPDDLGTQVVEAVQKKYNFKILDRFEIKSLGLMVTQFHTNENIYDMIKALEQENGVVMVQPNYIFQTLADPMDDLQSIRKMIDLETINTRLTGRGVNVGVVDTGVDLTHQDLSGAVVFSKNFLEDSPYRAEAHGTAVAGLIAARINNFGISGCAPEAGIFALRACEQISDTHPAGKCYTLSMAKALDTALDQGVHIINMSLGADVADALLSKIIDAGVDKGVLFVAPAGNQPEAERLFFPASHPDVVAVAGRNEDGSLLPNPDIAAKADLYGPCQNVFSCVPDNNHNFLTGTSLSSGIVSGILALSLEKNKSVHKENLPVFNGDLNEWTKALLK